MSDTYDEWLTELIIQYGVGKLIPKRVVVARQIGQFYPWWTKAESEQHMGYQQGDDFGFLGYVITPKAVEYLEAESYG